MFRSNMWALFFKATGKLASYNALYCIPSSEGDMPFVYYNREAARNAKTEKYSVVKVAVNIRAA